MTNHPQNILEEVTDDAPFIFINHQDLIDLVGRMQGINNTDVTSLNQLTGLESRAVYIPISYQRDRTEQIYDLKILLDDYEKYHPNLLDLIQQQILEKDDAKYRRRNLRRNNMKSTDMRPTKVIPKKR
ncbi:hypothetical protein Ciccas_002812 [Cichlidogyrus casuarinus]|uniref:Uncharacterized protein n=1 Tax=Cichlidogyrus casuarinus TaxID=1844966 RepID=A0ABD2QG72_9PLAT